METEDKTRLKWCYEAHKDRLTDKEQFILSMYIYNGWSVGRIAKFAHVEAMVVLARMRKAVDKML